MGSVIWGIIGSLIGVVVGVLLTARWQRKQWIQDNKKADYREVLEVFHDFWWKVTNYQAFYGESPFADLKAEGKKLQEQVAIMEALSSVLGTLGDSIFIRKAVIESRLIPEFQAFYHSLQGDNPPDQSRSGDVLNQMRLKLLRMAWRELRLEGPFPQAEQPGTAPGALQNG